jgi:anaerobic selenocysteine-containing dehydrogenase
LDFHVQTELFLSPTAELADIVLPAASSWESWHVGAVIGPLGDQAHVQLRPASITPRHESRSDMEVMFELAKRLGFGDRFWNGDIEAGFNHQFEPSGITVAQLKASPGGITIDLPMSYQKYSRTDDQGMFSGFPTPSRRIELYSIPFMQNGQSPLPEWRDPLAFSFPQGNIETEYPLLLVNSKVVEYSHSQHRSLPALRQRVPEPYLEINPEQADNLGMQDGDWVEVETPNGSITLQAKLTDGIAYDVVCTQNGWWQSCDDLNLNGYDPYSSKGANVNLLYPVDKIDPISGSLPIKGFPCRVKKCSGNK